MPNPSMIERDFMPEPYQEFEKKLEPWCGHKNVTVCNSGSSAIYLALTSLGIPKGSRVLVPDFTNIAVARACVLAGVEPVFADVAWTGNVGEKTTRLMETIKGITAAIIVHTYGNPVPTNVIEKLQQCIPFIIEDRAELHGVSTTPTTEQVDAICWSFQSTKILNCEEGGAVVFPDNNDLHLTAQLLRNHGDWGGYDHAPNAWNCRLSNANASLGLLSLEKFKNNMESRWTLYNQLVEGNKATPNAPYKIQYTQSPWVAWIKVEKPKKSVNAAIDFIQRNQVPARRAFRPLSMQKEFKNNLCLRRPDEWHNARELYDSSFVVHLSPGMQRWSATDTLEIIERGIDLIV